ncbi:MAG: hypothetical protein ACTSPX_04605, partial [Candidatus Thorarchaeota archaeon]
IVSEARLTASTTPATIASDKTEYGKGGSVQLTLEEPDLNDDAEARETISATFTKDEKLSATFKSVTVTPEAEVGKMTIQVNGLDAYANDTFTLVFRETGENTSVFELTSKLDLNNIVKDAGDNKPLVDGDRVSISWHDLFDNEKYEIEFTISAVEATVKTDRTEYPVSRDQVTIILSVDDSDANLDSEMRDHIIIGDDSGELVAIYDGTGELIHNFTEPEITLYETDKNTGVFEKELTVDQTTKDFPYWVDAELKIVYYDPSIDDTIEYKARFRVHDASLEVSPTKVQYGTDITITVTDADANLDSGSVDTITVEIEYTGADSPKSFTIDETGDNTGVFEGNLTVGEDFEPDLAEDITVQYTDDTPVTTTPSMTDWPDPIKREISLTGTTHTGTLELSATELGPGSKLKITLTDWDLNTDLKGKNTVEVRMKSNTDPNGITVTLEETDVSTGVFEKKIKLVLQAEGVSSIDDEQLVVSIGDIVQVVYIDEANEAGNTQSIVKSVNIVSVDPVIYFEKPTYLPGDVVTLTIEDMDANRDPDSVDRISRALRVESTSDPIGASLVAVETGDNTGVFTATVYLAEEPTSGAVYVEIGDILTATYTDEYPADYPETEEEKDFTATARIGAVVEYPVPASEPFLTDTTGAPIIAPEAGKMLLVQANITNEDAVEHSFVFLAQVKDENGVVIHLAGSGGTIAAGASMTPFVSWTPPVAGTYTVEVYVWESLRRPEALSPVMTYTFVVLE